MIYDSATAFFCADAKEMSEHCLLADYILIELDPPHMLVRLTTRMNKKKQAGSIRASIDFRILLLIPLVWQTETHSPASFPSDLYETGHGGKGGTRVQASPRQPSSEGSGMFNFIAFVLNLCRGTSVGIPESSCQEAAIHTR